LLQNFIEFESLCAGGRESEKADIRLHNKSALQSDPRGKHKTREEEVRRSEGVGEGCIMGPDVWGSEYGGEEREQSPAK
jgi:hypothetical protein